MAPTRRQLLNALALGAGAGALQALFPGHAAGQDTTDALVARIKADLAKHAGFGDKFSAALATWPTADWVAARADVRLSRRGADLRSSVLRQARRPADRGRPHADVFLGACHADRASG